MTEKLSFTRFTVCYVEMSALEGPYCILKKIDTKVTRLSDINDI